MRFPRPPGNLLLERAGMKKYAREYTTGNTKGQPIDISDGGISSYYSSDDNLPDNNMTNGDYDEEEA